MDFMFTVSLGHVMIIKCFPETRKPEYECINTYDVPFLGYQLALHRKRTIYKQKRVTNTTDEHDLLISLISHITITKAICSVFGVCRRYREVYSPWKIYENECDIDSLTNFIVCSNWIMKNITIYNLYTILTTLVVYLQSSTTSFYASVIKPVWFAHFAAHLKASTPLHKGVVTSALKSLLGGNTGIIREKHSVVVI